MDNNNAIRLAATVCLVRDSNKGIEILLLKRNPTLKVLGDYWVFPGGNVEPADHALTQAETLTNTAIRETSEETGINVQGEKLLAFSRWVTPIGLPKRFDTMFYLSKTSQTEVQIDRSEIIDAAWLTIDEAIRRHQEEGWKMMPPTLVTLLSFADVQNTSDLFAAFTANPIRSFLPQVQAYSPLTMVYQGDRDYQSEANLDEGLHRCVMNEQGAWDYLNE